MRPGGWTHSLTILSATIPGIPGFLIPKNSPKAHKTCLSAVDAANNPGSLLIGDKMSCSSAKLTMLDGRIASVARCTDRRIGTAMTVTSAGRYTPTSYELRSTSIGVRNGKPMRIESVSSGRLTHRC